MEWTLLILLFLTGTTAMAPTSQTAGGPEQTNLFELLLSNSGLKQPQSPAAQVNQGPTAQPPATGTQTSDQMPVITDTTQYTRTDPYGSSSGTKSSLPQYTDPSRQSSYPGTSGTSQYSGTSGASQYADPSGSSQYRDPSVAQTSSSGGSTQQPQTQMPQTHIPQTQVPQTQMPQTQMPQTQVPQTQMPQTQMPQTQVPQTQMPQTQMLQTQTQIQTQTQTQQTQPPYGPSYQFGQTPQGTSTGATSGATQQSTTTGTQGMYAQTRKAVSPVQMIPSHMRPQVGVLPYAQQPQNAMYQQMPQQPQMYRPQQMPLYQPNAQRMPIYQPNAQQMPMYQQQPQQNPMYGPTVQQKRLYGPQIPLYPGAQQKPVYPQMGPPFPQQQMVSYQKPPTNNWMNMVTPPQMPPQFPQYGVLPQTKPIWGSVNPFTSPVSISPWVSSSFPQSVTPGKSPVPYGPRFNFPGTETMQGADQGGFGISMNQGFVQSGSRQGRKPEQGLPSGAAKPYKTTQADMFNNLITMQALMGEPLELPAGARGRGLAGLPGGLAGALPGGLAGLTGLGGAGATGGGNFAALGEGVGAALALMGLPGLTGGSSTGTSTGFGSSTSSGGFGSSPSGRYSNQLPGSTSSTGFGSTGSGAGAGASMMDLLKDPTARAMMTIMGIDMPDLPPAGAGAGGQAGAGLFGGNTATQNNAWTMATTYDPIAAPAASSTSGLDMFGLGAGSTALAASLLV